MESLFSMYAVQTMDAWFHVTRPSYKLSDHFDPNNVVASCVAVLSIKILGLLENLN